MSCTLKNMSGSPGSIQYCAVSYNTSCKLTLQLNSDKYDVFYDLIIWLHVTTLKNRNFRRFRAKIPNFRAMRYCPKIVNINHLFQKKK